MSSLYEDRQAHYAAREASFRKLVYTCIGVAGMAILGGVVGCPHYNVWQQEMSGRAELARADQNRKIQIAEAEAQKEAAKRLAEAEIERARGVAEANRIIGNSLQGGEAYLRYLWIDKMQSGSQVIYVPTEAGLPILEAGKR